MVETVTANYGWTKPEVTKSASTWGGFLNGDLDSIDALVFANQQGIVPIGGIQMFGGAAAPANWLLCDGTSYVRIAPYDKLFAVLSTRFGAVDGSHFSVPNLTQRFPLGAGSPTPLGSAGGAFSASIATANLPAHAHPITDVAHGHGVNQWAHSHGAYQDAHSHGANQDSHQHAVPGSAGGGFGAAQPPQPVVAGQGSTLTDFRQPAVHIDTQQPGLHLDTQTSAISIQVSSTGLSTTQNTGSGTPLSVVPPFVAVYFIIRYV